MKTLVGGLFVIIGILVIIFGDIFLLISSIMDLIENGTTNLIWDIIKILFREIIAGAVGILFIGIGYIFVKD